MKKIVIIGGGEMGRAIHSLLPSEIEGEIFDKDEERQTANRPLADALMDASMVFLAVPAGSLTDLVPVLVAKVDQTVPVVSLSKALLPSGHLPYELLVSALGSKRPVVLSGPMLAEEILAGQAAGGVVAGTEAVTKLAVREIFNSGRLRLVNSEDPWGVNFCGVSKNIYVLGLAMSAALSQGENVRGLLVDQAIKEMEFLIPLFGGQAETVRTYAGLADLIATGSSQHSRHVMAGQEAVATGRFNTECEGALSLPALWPKVEKQSAHLPFLSAVAGVVINSNNPADVFKSLVSSVGHS